MFQARQGDVFIVEATVIPKTAQKQDRCILALGEATGHAHQIMEGATLYLDVDQTKYFEVDDPPYAGSMTATLLDDSDADSFLVATTLGTIRFARTTAKCVDGVVQTMPFALLKHEEHYFHAYHKGIYRMVQQREYFPEAIRSVTD